MTAIAVVYNKNWIAIAWDSAATSILANWNSKIFNANKIFRLSNSNQVWIWIYQNSMFWSLPRETIIKEYRKSQPKKFNTLQEYVDDFLNYLISSKFIENTNFEELFFNFLSHFNDHLKLYVQSKKDQTKEVLTEDSITLIVDEFINMLKSDLVNLSQTNLFQISISSKQIKINKSKYALSENEIQNIKSTIQNWGDLLILNFLDKLLDLFQDYLNNTQLIWSYSWLVFFWYWKQEMTPQLFHVILRAKFNDNTLLVDKYENEKNSDVWVNWYADNKVIFNSVRWFNPDLQWIIINEIMKIWQEKKLDYNELGWRINTIFEQYKSNEVNSFFWATAYLSIDELWQEAETLVNMSSFKKRISSDMETVWWMTDVAVITKGDWFIWIKRKHYFDPQLNSHYFN